jgi:hypothetical protein
MRMYDEVGGGFTGDGGEGGEYELLHGADELRVLL